MRRTSAVLLVTLVACSFDWDALDPRIVPDGGAAATGGGGMGGSSTSQGGGGGSSVGGGGAGGMTPQYSEPVLVPLISSDRWDEDDPTFTADGLELFFNTDRDDDNSNVWCANRASVDDDWGAPQRVEVASTPMSETNPAISTDGLRLWWSRTVGVDDNDIFVTTRPTRGADCADGWDTEVPVSELNTAGYDTVGAVTDDLLLMFFTRSPEQNLRQVTRPGPGVPWTNEEVVTALDSLFVDDQPWLSPDGLTVMFTSNRPDGGDLDIFVSQRADLSIDGWEIPTLVSEASTNQMDESDPWSLPDRSYIMFTRGPEGQGDRDIYEMRLLPSR